MGQDALISKTVTTVLLSHNSQLISAERQAQLFNIVLQLLPMIRHVSFPTQHSLIVSASGMLYFFIITIHFLLDLFQRA